MKVVRPASEAEVISGFLKSEYHHREYQRDRQQFESLVMDPDPDSERQNVVRRELLYRRHAANWSSLPRDTRWHLCEADPGDISDIRLFQRRPWAGIAAGSNLVVSDVVQRIRQGGVPRDCAREVAAIQVIAYRMRHHPMLFPVLLIGISITRPLTILDGNRRLLAAALAGEDLSDPIQVYCGLSSRMAECYCYGTSRAKQWKHDRLLHFQTAFLKTAVTRWNNVATRLAQVW